MRRIVFFLTICFLAIKAFPQVLNLMFDKITTENGLSNNQINQIIKDKLGFVWIATDDGLNRYDGYSFKVFKHNIKEFNSLSDNKVFALFEDSEGILWVGLRNHGISRFDRNTETFKNFSYTEGVKNSIVGNEILSFFEDRKGKIWIGSYQGISIFDKKTEKFENHRTKDSSFLKSDGIFCMLEDNNQNIWCFNFLNEITVYNQKKGKFELVTIPLNGCYWKKVKKDADGNFWIVCYDCGLIKYDPIKREIIKNYSYLVHNNSYRSVDIDAENTILLCSDGGGFCMLNPKNETCEIFKNSKYNPKSICSDALYNVFVDNQNIIWLGSFNKGINILDKQRYKFELYTNNPEDKNSLSSKSIISIFEDSKKRIWLGTDGDGLLLFDRKQNTFRQFKQDNNNKNALSSNIISSLEEDNYGNLLVGTYYNGLNVFNVDKNTNTIFKLNLNSKETSISSNNVWKILKTKNGTIYLGFLRQYDGYAMQIFDDKNQKFKNEPIIDGLQNNIMTLFEDSKSNLWIGTENGGAFVYHPDKSYQRFVNNPYNANSITNNDVRTIFEDKNGLIWLGTEGGGLNVYNTQTKKFKAYAETEALNGNCIHGILEDQNQNLWISTTRGLSLWNRNTAKFTNFGANDGLQTGSFNQNAAIKSSTGEFYFCGTDGFNVFSPAKISLSTLNTEVFINQLLILNKEIKIADETEILSKSIILTQKITLSHANAKMFTLAYSALVYSNQNYIKYAYKLEGFDKAWNYVGNERKANYTNINQGTYTFRVKATNTDGVWSKKEAILKIVILPPWWKTWWACTLYVLIIIAFIFLFRLYIIAQQNLKLQIKIKTFEKQQAEEINKAKLHFFTNISHEIRTPLTLIIGPINQIIESGKGDKTLKMQFQIMQRNAKRLLTLVNQLLDFRKMESNNMQLHISNINLNELLQDIISAFNELARQRNIKCELKEPESIVEAWVDYNRMESVFYNLLSNAFKYTPVNGTIEVKLCKTDTNKIEISVCDTGIGIAEEHIMKIFDNFYQIGSSSTYNQDLGSLSTGIGLSLTKSIVELHKGTIFAKSEMDKGSCFIVQLPTGNSHFMPSQLVARDLPVAHQLLPEPLDNTNIGDELHSKASKSTIKILVVDDNSDICAFISSVLSNKYNVINALNGKEALSLATSETPDLIISDVIMPEMNGIEFCKLIKNNINTSHIPVIMLTARTSVDNQIEGLESGADDYITKPFVPEILELKVKNILETRLKLRLKLNKQFPVVEEAIGFSEMDKDFLEKANRIVNENIQNTQFSLELFSENLGVGKRKLQMKLKILINQTPNEFVRTIRLNKSLPMLKEKQLSISQIAYEVGFSSPTYFATCFKEQFGVSPLQYTEL